MKINEVIKLQEVTMKLKNQLPHIRLGVQILSMLLILAGILYGLPLLQGSLIFITILMGPVFCGWICPFGLLQDLMIRLSDLLHIKRKPLPKNFYKAMTPLRYLLLAISLFVTAGFVFTFFSYDPRAGIEAFLAGNQIALAGWAIIGTFLLLGLFYERPFCNSLCIEGAKYGALSIARPFTVVRNDDKCVDCGLCDRSCPMHITVSKVEQVRSPQCISCMNCVSACPKEGALSFDLMPFRRFHKGLLILAGTLFIAFGAIYTMIGNQYQSVDLTSASIESVTDTESLVGGDATGVADGVYTGTGTGYRGDMTVQVTVENEVITAVQIVSSSDDSKWLNRAYSTVASEIISTQTADVDTVSGATYSSMGIKEAVADALVSAGSTVAESIENDVTTSERSRGHGHSF
jgi:uncharacterized protein with FMN-binding domain/NAD-dependent dihydropyrimidine dehydrogenase PreA subunit